MTLDLNMPGISGMEVLRRLPADGPGVIVVSAYTDEGSALAIEALSIGAADVVRKPQLGSSMARFSEELEAAVQSAVATRRARPRRPGAQPPPSRRPAPPRALRPTGAPPATSTTGRPGAATPSASQRTTRRVTRPLVIIACSTGGPRALADFVPTLPSPCGAGVLIVQHMPAGFTAPLAARLDARSKLTVREARAGDRVASDLALMAPGGWHLRLRGERIELSEEPPIGGLRPRADVTIADVAREFAGRTVLIVLTGMGNDGLAGAKAIKAAGGIVLTEAEQTCVVYGMPRSVEEAGLSDVVRPLDELGAALRSVIAQ